MLDSDPVSLCNSQELMLGVAQEGPATPGFRQSGIVEPGRLAGK